MFAPDVVSLRQFYISFLGMQSCALVDAAIHRFWPPLGQDTVLSIGYGLPYLESCGAVDSAAFVAMPAAQGAVHWPSGGNSRIFLSHESELPLADNSINRVLLIHSAEHSDQLEWMMREVWRVLTPGGRVLAVVPNRRGAWARSGRSPFGYGRPFSMSQMRYVLMQHEFTITRSSSALFMPPTYIESAWKIARHIEMLGRMFCPFVGGVLLIEAQKQLYAAVGQSAHARRPFKRPVAAVPVMSRK